MRRSTPLPNKENGTDLRALIELLRGHGAHADAIQCFRGLSAEQAGQKPAGFPYSVWQLLEHLNYWTGYELARIGGAPQAYPEHAGLSWPAEAAPADSGSWEAGIARFEKTLDELSRLAGSAPDVLDRPVAPLDAGEAEHDATLRGVLWQTAVHNSYHLGQVALLRRVLGAWPPPGGGDTW